MVKGINNIGDGPLSEPLSIRKMEGFDCVPFVMADIWKVTGIRPARALGATPPEDTPINWVDTITKNANLFEGDSLFNVLNHAGIGGFDGSSVIPYLFGKNNQDGSYHFFNDVGRAQDQYGRRVVQVLVATVKGNTSGAHYVLQGFGRIPLEISSDGNSMRINGTVTSTDGDEFEKFGVALVIFENNQVVLGHSTIIRDMVFTREKPIKTSPINRDNIQWIPSNHNNTNVKVTAIPLSNSATPMR
jgi:hypothetical protein